MIKRLMQVLERSVSRPHTSYRRYAEDPQWNSLLAARTELRPEGWSNLPLAPVWAIQPTRTYHGICHRTSLRIGQMDR